ncbi:hypothetical protein [Streptomyces sp. NPDC058653]|uniref:hypothetical protein n=1 Tax=Streptomyces sp. NPDC058653 TaxID=3346576 RepID=UPI0036684123
MASLSWGLSGSRSRFLFGVFSGPGVRLFPGVAESVAERLWDGEAEPDEGPPLVLGQGGT